MGYRYSKVELGRIKSLIQKGLTNREIALRLGRSEAGIRNIRHRLKLTRKTEDCIKSLQEQKKKIEPEIEELNQTKNQLTSDIQALETKKAKLLNFNEELMKTKIEDKLIELKIEKPELFYISGEEQIAIFVGHLLKRIVS